MLLLSAIYRAQQINLNFSNLSILRVFVDHCCCAIAQQQAM